MFRKFRWDILSNFMNDGYYRLLYGSLLQRLLDYCRGEVWRLYRDNPHWHPDIIADNLPLHKHPGVLDWVSRRRTLTHHFTPTYASRLNQIEIRFNVFAGDVVKGAVWKSKKELVDQIMFCMRRYNRGRAHPFMWTYSGKGLAEEYSNLRNVTCGKGLLLFPERDNNSK